MEEDILNYLPTVMFRGTPCIFLSCFKCISMYPVQIDTYIIHIDIVMYCIYYIESILSM